MKNFKNTAIYIICYVVGMVLVDQFVSANWVYFAAFLLGSLTSRLIDENTMRDTANRAIELCEKLKNNWEYSARNMKLMADSNLILMRAIYQYSLKMDKEILMKAVDEATQIAEQISKDTIEL